MGVEGTPLQILAGIEANPSPTKDLGLLLAPPDFQTFLRPLQSHFQRQKQTGMAIILP